MTKTILTTLLGVLALTSCSEKKAPSASVPPPDVPTLPDPVKPAESTPPPPEKTDPMPASTAEVAPPPARPTVGGDVWAISRISTVTEDGVVGVAPGTRLRVVRETDTGFVVTDGRQEYSVTEAQVSVDNRIGSGAAQADAAARAANQDWQAAQAAKGAQVNRASGASQALGELQNKLHLLTREEAQLQASLRQAQQDEYSAQVARQQRRVYTRTTSPAQVSQWRARLPIVQAEKDKVFWELKRAQQ